MIGFIITGHGEFASGLISSVNLVAGDPPQIEGVDFVEILGSDELKEKLEEKLKTMNDQCEGIIFFTDLAGGTPFKVAVELSQGIENCGVMAGANIPMILENLFNRTEISLDDFLLNCVESGKGGIVKFELKVKEDEYQLSDGI